MKHSFPIYLIFLFMLSSEKTILAQELIPAGQEMQQPIQEYIAGLRDLYRGFSDMTYTKLAEEQSAYFTQWENQLQKLPFEKFSQEGKVDFLLLKNTIARDRYNLAQQQQVWKAIQPAFPFAGQIMRLVQMRHYGNKPDAKSVAGTYDSIGNEIKKYQVNPEQIDLDNIHSLPAAMEIANSLRRNLRDVYKFYNGYDPDFTWWVATSYKTTDSLFAGYIEELRKRISEIVASHDNSNIPGVPIGRPQVLELLKLDMITHSPEELIDIARQEYSWCLSEMKKASAAMGFKDNWKAAWEAVKNDVVPVGEQPKLIDSLQNEALDFIAAHDLIRVPELAKKTWTMKMMTPREQLVNPFFYGGTLISISYPTNTMSFKGKMESIRGNNIYTCRATVFHELLPGHYLQYFMGERYRTYRRPFETAFWTEGWAFYWEMLLWKNGFDKTPEQKIGALNWWMTRCARIIFSLNFHLGKWTPGQCVQYLVDSVDLERANAEAEVRRSFGGSYDPLYQIAYMTGALQFMALHHELVDGGKMSNNEFHLKILKENNIPVEMVKALLENTPLKRNYQPDWKFYNDAKHN